MKQRLKNLVLHNLGTALATVVVLFVVASLGAFALRSAEPASHHHRKAAAPTTTTTLPDLPSPPKITSSTTARPAPAPTTTSPAATTTTTALPVGAPLPAAARMVATRFVATWANPALALPTWRLRLERLATPGLAALLRTARPTGPVGVIDGAAVGGADGMVAVPTTAGQVDLALQPVGATWRVSAFEQ